MSRTVLFISLLFCAAAFGWGYGSSFGWAYAVGSALIALLWLAAELRGWGWFSHVGFAILSAAAGLGVFLGVELVWMLAGAVFALTAWDMSAFTRRLKTAAADDRISDLESRHFLWLSVIAGVSFLAGISTQVIRLKLAFGWGVLLAVLSVAALSQLVSWLKKRQL
jgi:hypothetical protein